MTPGDVSFQVDENDKTTMFIKAQFPGVAEQDDSGLSDYGAGIMDPNATRILVLVNSVGKSVLVEGNRFQIASRMGISQRDLRLVDPWIPMPYPTSLMIRKGSLLANLGAVRVVISSTECLVLSIGRVTEEYIITEEPEVHDEFIKDLIKAVREPEGIRGSAWERALHHDSHLPFELRALEVALSAAMQLLDVEVNGVVRAAKRRLKLLSNGSMQGKKLLSELKGIRQDATTLGSRVRKFKSELDEIMEDDQDMLDMYLQRRQLKALEASASVSGADQRTSSAARVSARPTSSAPPATLAPNEATDGCETTGHSVSKVETLADVPIADDVPVTASPFHSHAGPSELEPFQTASGCGTDMGDAEPPARTGTESFRASASMPGQDIGPTRRLWRTVRRSVALGRHGFHTDSGECQSQSSGLQFSLDPYMSAHLPTMRPSSAFSHRVVAVKDDEDTESSSSESAASARRKSLRVPSGCTSLYTQPVPLDEVPVHDLTLQTVPESTEMRATPPASAEARVSSPVATMREDIREGADPMQSAILGELKELKEISNKHAEALQDQRPFVNPHDVQDVEAMLEAYSLQADFLIVQLNDLSGFIDDFQAHIQVDLDRKRNALFALQLVATIVTMCVSFVAMIAGLFGMNLNSGVESAGGWFWGVTAVSVGFASSVATFLIVYLRQNRMLFLGGV